MEKQTLRLGFISQQFMSEVFQKKKKKKEVEGIGKVEAEREGEARLLFQTKPLEGNWA